MHNTLDNIILPSSRLSILYNELFFALVTAVFVSIVFYSVNYFIKMLKIWKYYGYWSVMQYNDANYDYDSTKSYVIISRLSSSTLKFSYQEMNTFNVIDGNIYFDSKNADSGSLVSGYTSLTQTTGLFPVNEKKIFIDKKKAIASNKNRTIIRIINANGFEKEIWMKPNNQKEFIKLIASERENYLFWTPNEVS